MSGRKRGLKGLKGVKRSRQMFMCKVPGCKVTPRGCDLSKHYKNRTDWSKVKELRAVVGTDAVQRELEQVDSHTRFAFTNNYLPSCSLAHLLICSSAHRALLVNVLPSHRSLLPRVQLGPSLPPEGPRQHHLREDEEELCVQEEAERPPLHLLHPAQEPHRGLCCGHPQESGGGQGPPPRQSVGDLP